MRTREKVDEFKRHMREAPEDPWELACWNAANMMRLAERIRRTERSSDAVPEDPRQMKLGI